MKRLLLVLGAALLWAALSPSPVSAHWWPFGHHNHNNKPDATNATSANASPSPAPVQKQTKTKHSFWHHHDQVQHSNPNALYNFPKSVGWFHKGPGPAGAGS